MGSTVDHSGVMTNSGGLFIRVRGTRGLFIPAVSPCPWAYNIILKCPGTAFRCTAAMSYSLTLSQTHSKLDHCRNVLETFAMASSSGENVTLMAEFTTTLLSTSDGSVAFETHAFSMWTVTTQTSSLLEDLRLEATITRQKMVTLLLESSGDLLGDPEAVRMEVEYQEMVISGLNSWAQKLEMSFLRYSQSMLRKLSSVLSHQSPSMRIGSMRQAEESMRRLEGCSVVQAWRNSMTGAADLLELLGIVEPELSLMRELIQRDSVILDPNHDLFLAYESEQVSMTPSLASSRRHGGPSGDSVSSRSLRSAHVT